MEGQVSLTKFASMHNINRDELLEFLISEGVVSSISRITAKGESIGISYFDGGSIGRTGKWPVYGTETEELIKNHTFIRPLNEHKVKEKPINSDSNAYNNDNSNNVYNFSNLGIDNFVILDTETTSMELDDEVIELSIIDKNGNELYGSLFYTDHNINPFAAKKSGIKKKALIDKPRFIDEWEKISDILRGKLIIAHNSPFDIRLILQTLFRYNVNPRILESAIRILSNNIDSIEFTKKYIKGRKSYSLESLCKDYEISTEQTHRAADDCRLVLLWINKLNEIIGG